MRVNFLKKFLLSGFAPQEKNLLLVLFLSSLFNAVYQIAIIKEFTVATNNMQTNTYLFFAFLHAFLGMGAYFAFKYFEHLFKPRNMRAVMFLTSIFIILSLYFSLKIDDTNRAPIVFQLFFTCLSFMSFGIIYSLVIIYISKNRPDYLGIGLAYGIFGVMAGFFLEPYAALYLGVNATCVILALSLVALSAGPVISLAFLPIAVLAVYVYPLDIQVERLRTIGSSISEIVLDQNMARRPGARKHYKENRSICSGWSPYSKIDILYRDTNRKITGMYNYRIIWNRLPEQGWRWKAPLSFIRDNDKVFIIGAGAGKEVDLFPDSRVPSKENTTLVEIDPLVVKFFTEDHPEYNDNIFNRVNVIAADGRTVLDELKEKQDVIIINALKAPTANIWMLSKRRNHLYTYECLKRCLEMLSEDGVLLIDQNNTYPITAVCSVLNKLNANFVVYNFKRGEEGEGNWHVYSTRSKERLKQIFAATRSIKYMPHHVETREDQVLTDDRPFMNFVVGSEKNSILNTLNKCLLFIFCVVGVILLLLYKNKAKKRIIYFFLIGTAFALTHIFILSKFRAFFSHPLKTITITTFMFLAAVACGNLLSGRVKIDTLRNRLFMHLFFVVATLAYFYLAISHIPFSVSNYFIKLAVAVAVIFPMGLVCGFFYPVGILANRNKNLGYAFLFDGLGACAAFLIFYIVSFLFGISANFFAVAICYILSVLLISL